MDVERLKTNYRTTLRLDYTAKCYQDRHIEQRKQESGLLSCRTEQGFGFITLKRITFEGIVSCQQLILWNVWAYNGKATWTDLWPGMVLNKKKLETEACMHVHLRYCHIEEGWWWGFEGTLGNDRQRIQSRKSIQNPRLLLGWMNNEQSTWVLHVPCH